LGIPATVRLRASPWSAADGLDAVAADHGQMPHVRRRASPAHVQSGEAMTLRDAWAYLWRFHFFRAFVAFDVVMVTGMAALLSYCFFDGKIGLLK
jgi:hypothetical protein